MSARDLQALALLLGLGSFAACGGTTTKDTTDVTDQVGDDDDDDDDNQPKHSEGGGYFDIAFAYFQAQFTYDASTASIVELQSPYGALPGTIDIQLASPDWQAVGFDPARTDLYCTISLVLDDSAIPTWVSGNPNLWYGTDYTGGLGATNCNEAGYELDPNLWGTDPLADIASLPGWGVAVGEPGQDAADYIADFPTEDQVYYFGGIMVNPMFGEGYELDTMLSYTFQIDEATYEPVDDGTGYLVPIEKVNVNLGNGISSGWYQVVDIYIWQVS